MFVTYCLIQLIKETERRQALINDPDPLPPPPPPATVTAAQVAEAPATVPPPVADPSKEKAE